MWLKGAPRVRQVGVKKASESETTEDVSKRKKGDIKTEVVNLPQEESGSDLLTAQMVSGMEVARA